MSIVAEYDSECPFCFEAIEADIDDITYVHGEGWAHDLCAEEDAHQETNR